MLMLYRRFRACHKCVYTFIMFFQVNPLSTESDEGASASESRRCQPVMCIGISRTLWQHHWQRQPQNLVNNFIISRQLTCTAHHSHASHPLCVRSAAAALYSINFTIISSDSWCFVALSLRVYKSRVSETVSCFLMRCDFSWHSPPLRPLPCHPFVNKLRSDIALQSGAN